MLEVKYKSPAFGMMTADQLCVAGQVIVLKIHVIAGWVLPVAELMDVLIDQLTKKLTESYANVNADEVEYAFRNHTTVKDWGKAMNLAMIDEVMIPYLQNRRQLSDMEEKLSNPAQLGYQVPAMTDEELMNATFETFKVIKKHEFIPVSVYDYLVSQGEINLTLEQKKSMAKTVDNLISINIANDRQFAFEYDRIQDKQAWRRNEYKKFAVGVYFNSLILKGC